MQEKERPESGPIVIVTMTMTLMVRKRSSSRSKTAGRRQPVEDSRSKIASR